MSDNETHKITWLSKEYHRHKLINCDGRLFRGRSEFVETDPEEEPIFECGCGETFESKDQAREHLKNAE